MPGSYVTRPSSTRRTLLSLLGISLLACATYAKAPQAAEVSNWPAQPIRLILGYPPGGGTNAVARLMADQMSKTLGQQVVVENRPGASGTIGALHVARSAPDGYTLLFSTAASLTGAPLTMKGLQYDPINDLAPITLVGNGPFLLVANPKFPPNTLPELIEYARAHPGKVNYASPGNSTANYFFTELINLDTGIKTVNVPYKGSSGLVNDLVGGYVQYTLETPGTTLPLVRDGRLKALAVFDTERLSGAPDIPTTVEAGFPQLVGGSWYGILAPAGTPDPIIDRIYKGALEALNTPEVQAALKERDVLARGSTPQEFKTFINDEYKKWQSVTQRLGIVPN